MIFKFYGLNYCFGVTPADVKEVVREKDPAEFVRGVVRLGLDKFELHQWLESAAISCDELVLPVLNALLGKEITCSPAFVRRVACVRVLEAFESLLFDYGYEGAVVAEIKDCREDGCLVRVMLHFYGGSLVIPFSYAFNGARIYETTDVAEMCADSSFVLRGHITLTGLADVYADMLGLSDIAPVELPTAGNLRYAVACAVVSRMSVKAGLPLPVPAKLAARHLADHVLSRLIVVNPLQFSDEQVKQAAFLADLGPVHSDDYVVPEEES